MSKTPQQFYRHGQQQRSTPLASTGEQRVITATSLNVRAGAGTQFGVQFALESGAIVDVLEQQNDWVHIRDEQGRDGWVAARFTAVLE